MATLSYLIKQPVCCWCEQKDEHVYAHVGPERGKALLTVKRRRSQNLANDYYLARVELSNALRQLADKIDDGVESA